MKAHSWLATSDGLLVAGAKSPGGDNMYGHNNTFGDYSNVVVVKQDFVLKIPNALPVEAAAPILCAGVTMFSPTKHWGVKAEQSVGVVGSGSLVSRWAPR